MHGCVCSCPKCCHERDRGEAFRGKFLFLHLEAYCDAGTFMHSDCDDRGAFGACGVLSEYG